MSQVPLREDALLEAIHNLTDVVSALKQTITDDYPKRAEIERKYATKYGMRQRAMSLVLCGLLAVLGGYAFSIYTVSYCFLQNDPQDPTKSKPYCDLMPGYSAAVERNRVVYGVFNDITNTTRENRTRIEKLEKRLP
jgi:hypothetical protein